MLGFKKKEEIHERKTIRGAEVDNINISTSSTEVEIFPGTADEITAELKGEISSKLKDNVDMTVTKQGESLDIEVKVEQESGFRFGFDVIDLKLSVEVPEKLYEEISVETSSGSIMAKELEGKKVSFRASSGEVEASRIKAHTEFKSKANSGGIQLNGIEAKEIHTKTSSGSMLLQKLAAEDIHAKASSGRIIVKKWIGNLTAESSSGGVDLHAPEMTGNIDAEASSGDVMLHFDQGPDSFVIDFSGSSGEAHMDIKGVDYQEKSEHRISGKAGDGKYKIRVKTSSGDFDFR
ncbi:DUF4097 family beta strand repeat-containing protein [Bacillus sp. SG-1]|uniref:DUF4097 family beta strand repeat-containing protein n=1 Tax=Bacillus sp. SG-1 TaxID=161544 RepID=UPI0002EB9622|nr:DUF4097 family beta strand repeat-containing protein [Bacillus sp. SG-1]